MKDPIDIESDSQIDAEVDAQILIDEAHDKHEVLKRELSTLVIEMSLGGTTGLIALLAASDLLIGSRQDPSLQNTGFAVLMLGFFAVAYAYNRLGAYQRTDGELGRFQDKNADLLKGNPNSSKEP